MIGARERWTPRVSRGQTLVILLLVGLAFPFFAGSNYMVQVASLALTYVVLAQCLNAVYGYTGYLSLAQTALWGVGGYLVAVLTVKAGLGPWTALLITGPTTAVLGIAVGYISLRLTRYAFSIVTLVMLLGTGLLAIYWTAVTNGSQGIIGVPLPHLNIFGRTVLLESVVALYYVTLAVAVVLLAAMYCGLSSRWGTILRGIKLDEELSASFGVRVFHHKLAVFTLAAFCSGTMGAVHVFRVSIIDPTIFTLPAAVIIVAIVMLGGPGSFVGVIVAGVGLTFLPELLRFSDGGRFFFFGLILMLASIAFPEGVVQTIAKRARARKGHRVAESGDVPETVAPSPQRPLAAPSTSSTHEPVLEVLDLKRHFGGVKAVDGATFTVRRGSITALIGPNGSGKTSTIDCITGFSRPDGGAVRLCGRSLKGESAAGHARLGVRRTFQQVRSFGDLSVLDHLMMARYPFDGVRHWDWIARTRALRIAEDESLEIARKTLALLSLERVAQHPVDQLSYGQRKLVALACSLMSEPEILCLDEPLAGVNPTVINEISEAIALLRASGQTFLIVEHNVDFVVALADHVVVMAEGRVIADGGPEVVRSDPAVLESFLGVR